MAKSTKATVKRVENGLSIHSKQLMASPKTVDPTLAALFQSTLVGNNRSFSNHSPVKSPVSKDGELPSPKESSALSTESLALKSRSWSENETTGSEHKNSSSLISGKLAQEKSQIGTISSSTRSAGKRKRGISTVEVEDSYMQRLAEEEAREEVKRQKVRRTKEIRGDAEPYVMDDASNSANEEIFGLQDDQTETEHDYTSSIPRHETLSSTEEVTELDKASRTVFLANVSTQAIKSKTSRKALLDHLVSFVPSLPAHKPSHKIISIRFRSTAFSTSSVPKKAAFVNKELMDATTQSTNAYVVFSTALAAREAVKILNGSVVLDRHLRVDGIAHPAKIDHRRCVFVGNLGFVDDESMIKKAEDEDSNRKPRKVKEPADIEEGLWRQFSNAGIVESVRVIRDKVTRVGKGIAYVQFQNPNSVEKALFLNEKSFPPMLPRKLRVTRAKNIRKTTSHSESNRVRKKSFNGKRDLQYRPKPASEVQSVAGRASKLFGRAGAAQLQKADHQRSQAGSMKRKLDRVPKPPESIVFEGYRASSKQRKDTLKVGGSGKKHGKPQTRSSRRGAAFKATGGKKRP